MRPSFVRSLLCLALFLGCAPASSPSGGGGGFVDDGAVDSGTVVRDTPVTPVDAGSPVDDVGGLVDVPAAIDTGPVNTGARVGAACARDADCADGWCADLASGYCSRRRCDMADCPAGSECTYLVRTGLPSVYVCLRECSSTADCGRSGYACERGHCVAARPDAGPPVDTGTRCRSNVGSDCPVGQACSATGQCTTTCSFDWRCNGGCCAGSRCAMGVELNSCGTSSSQAWRCGDCARGCTSGAACRAVTGGGACACTSCRPIGASCSVSTDCCTRSCAGLNGNLRCQG